MTSTFFELTSVTGSACPASSTSTFGRLREERARFSSTASVISTTWSRPSAFIFCARSFVFGWSTLKSSTTESLPSRASWERIDAMPARYILRLTFWLKFSSGELGKILPPPRQSGLPLKPARARPVPFCRHGFRCERVRSPRAFCALVPSRAFAW